MPLYDKFCLASCQYLKLSLCCRHVIGMSSPLGGGENHAVDDVTVCNHYFFMEMSSVCRRISGHLLL